MGEDSSSTRPVTDGRQVMAAIDSDSRGPKLVIADISADESWLSIPASSAANLTDWR